VLNFDRSTVKRALQNIPNDCHQWLSDSCSVHQIRFRPGAPDPADEAYSSLLGPLDGLRGPTSEGREGNG